MAAAVLLAALGAPAQAQEACTSELGPPPCEGGGDPGSSPPAGSDHAHVGNPFDAVSGNKYQAVVDYRAPDSALAFARHYNSALSERDDGLGRGWRHGYTVELWRLERGGYRIRQADGRAVDFAAEPEPMAGGRRHAARDASDGWLEATDRHVWVLPEGRRLEFSGPHLVAVRYADGRALSIERDGARPLAVTDESGGRLSFVYAPGEPGLGRYGEPLRAPSGHLERVVLPNGDELDYRYDERLQLVSVTDSRGAGARYSYAAGEIPGLLTAVSDDLAGHEGRWRYEDGRAVEWFDPVNGDGVVIAQRSGGPAGGTLQAHRTDGAVDHMTWARDEARPLHPRIERRRVANGSRHAELARLPSAQARAGDDEAPPEDAARDRFDTAGLVETERTVQRDGRTVRVRAFTDRLGVLHDIEVDGVRASDIARELAAGSDVCAGERRAACLAQARLLVDIALELDADRRPPLQRRGRQHVPGGAVCPLPPYVDCAELAHQREMAMLSSCVYSTGACSTGYRPVDPKTVGLTAEDLSIGSFHAELFIDPVSGNYVLAFRGTDDGPDWTDNGRNAVGLNSDQYSRAVDIVERIDRFVARMDPAPDLEFTGHSLGGGLATLAAVAVDRRATVFNAAAVHPDTARWNRQDLANAGYLVDAIRLEGEPISGGQRIGGAFNFLVEQLFGSREHVFVGDAPGQRHDIPQPDEAWIQREMAARGTGRSVAIHSIAAVIRSLELLFDAHCTP